MSGYVLHSDDTRVVIATLKSDNVKTGNMIQVWILCKDQSPPDAVRSGLDAEICGDCRLRGTDGWSGRTCYVNVAQGPLAVWRAWKAGKYRRLSAYKYAQVFSGRAVRFGAYGDPVYIPLPIVWRICAYASRWTGYTHQWRRSEYQPYRKYLMASADTAQDHVDARLMHWRTFRVRHASDPVLVHEIMCPAADETGHKTTCEQCGLCNGRADAADARKDIVIIAHGIGKKNLIQIGAAA